MGQSLYGHGEAYNLMADRVRNKVITTMVMGLLDDHTYCARFAVISFGALAKNVRLFMASLHSQPMALQMHAIYIFVDFQPIGCNLKGGLINPIQFGRLGARGGRG